MNMSVELLGIRWRQPFLSECKSVEDAQAKGERWVYGDHAYPLAILVDGDVKEIRLSETHYEWTPAGSCLELMRQWVLPELKRLNIRVDENGKHEVSW